MKTTKKFFSSEQPIPGEPPRLREDEMQGCGYGAYPWDVWQRWAFAHSVPLELATLGRAVIREAWQHGWSDLLDTDGGRVDPAIGEVR